MKVGVLIDRLTVGGVEKIAIEEVRALRRQGVNATLVVLRRQSSNDASVTFDSLLENIPVTYLDDRLPRFLRLSFRIPLFSFFSWFHLSYPLILPFWIKRREFDYLIVHGTYTSLSAISFKKRCDIPFSSFIWDPVGYIIDRVYSQQLPRFVTALLRPIARHIDTKIIKQTGTILTGGNAHNAFFHSIAPQKTITTIYPSVHPIKKPLTKKGYVLIITAWKRGKHPEYLYDLATALPSLQIKMAGKWIDPAYEAEFRQGLKERNLEDSIEVIGAVSEEELSRLYTHATVLLQTNDDKGFGMPALEAAGNGTTFIIPEKQGVCDLFEDSEHGYYTTEKDTDAITSRLRHLLAHPVLAKNMGERAWQHVRANYSWTNHAKQLLHTIQSNIKEAQ